MIGTNTAAVLILAIHRHPDPERACAMLEDITQRMAAGEDPEIIRAMYAEDLAFLGKLLKELLRSFHQQKQ